MPLVIIWHAWNLVDEECVPIRDKLEQLVAQTLEVEPKEVELRVRSYSRHDKNTPMIGIEVQTGTGKNFSRFKQRKELSLKLEEGLREDPTLIPEHWRGPTGCYIWFRVGGSSFIPIGHPELAR